MRPARAAAPLTHLRTLALASLLLSSPLLVPAASSQQLQKEPIAPGYLPIGEYTLELDGKIDSSARFYHSASQGFIMVRSDRLGSTLVLSPRDRAYDAYPNDEVEEQEDGTLDLLFGAQPVGNGPFELVDFLPNFEVEGKKARFLHTAPLLGARSAAELKRHNPAYAQRSSIYEPQTFYLDQLRSVKQEVRIKVYFGSWCSTCTKLMPRILRVEEELAGSAIRFDYYGLPQQWDDADAERDKVRHLPTGIFLRDGVEIGRIEGHGWSYPAMAIMRALGRS